MRAGGRGDAQTTELRERIVVDAQILRADSPCALDVYDIKLGGALGTEIHIDAGSKVILAFGMQADHATKAAFVSKRRDDEERSQVFGSQSQRAE